MKHTIAWLLALIALAGAGYGLYQFGMSQGMRMAGGSIDLKAGGIAQGEAATRRHISAGLKAGDVDPMTGQKILYYHDPMVPGKRFDAPGKSPFMDMMLVPVYAGTSGDDASQVSLSPRVQQSLGLRTAEVVEGMLSPRLTAIGNIAWNERDQVVLQARANGFVETVRARANLDRVKRGDPLAEIYFPEWVAAQEEFLALRRIEGSNVAMLADAAKARMRQVGMNDTQIARVEQSGTVERRFELAAPIDGVITEVMIRDGMAVMAGATLFRITGTASVWANAEVPESQAALLRMGAKVSAHSPALPGEVFAGMVQALLPEINPATRTQKARVELTNRAGKLAPGMFVEMRFAESGGVTALIVPSDAVIHTGQRSVVMLAEDGGKFRPVTVETGPEHDGKTEIKRGLTAGQRVVVSAQFLIDSEASLKGVETRLNRPEAIAQAKSHRTTARVEGLSSDTITLTHPRIESLKWPEMTMDFKLPASLAHDRGLAAGDQVEIDFHVQGNDVPQITAIRRLAQATRGGKK